MARNRRMMSEETRRTLMTRQANLTALTKHPSWPELQEEVARKRIRIEKLVLAKTISAKPGSTDVHEISYLAGFVAGMQWFAAVPENAERSLEAFLREQGVQTEGALSAE